jgi:hypothetical protein
LLRGFFFVLCLAVLFLIVLFFIVLFLAMRKPWWRFVPRVLAEPDHAGKD